MCGRSDTVSCEARWLAGRRRVERLGGGLLSEANTGGSGTESLGSLGNWQWYCRALGGGLLAGPGGGGNSCGY